jgi:hypothetical protein
LCFFGEAFVNKRVLFFVLMAAQFQGFYACGVSGFMFLWLRRL